MDKTWLIFDANHLCHRILHTQQAANLDNGIIYGFLRSVIATQEIHNTDNVVFCFDHGSNKRKELLPIYKDNREAFMSKTSDLLAKRRYLQAQMKLLKEEVLPEAGYNNILFEDGYEGDDLIASVCKNSIQRNEEAIIVSSDHDLYQLLNKNVWMWKPIEQKAYTMESLLMDHKVKPSSWPWVKAIAGCRSDNIRGVFQVGEGRAVDYLNGRLKPTSTLYKAILNQDMEERHMNLKLVTLPFTGTPIYQLKQDEVTGKKWRKLATRLDMPSLITRPPLFNS